MSYTKSILFTLLVLIGALVGYSYFKYDSHYALKKALSAYKKKEYSTSEYYLSVLNEKKIPQYSLYQGYIERAKGNFDISSKLFSDAEIPRNNLGLVEERNFNGCLNAYLQKDFELLSQKLSLCSERGEAYHLFMGMSHYQRKEYKIAKDHFLQVKPLFNSSEWMQFDWGVYFNDAEISYHTCHSLIESNEPFRARQEIETFLTTSNNKEPRFSYLLGLSYFKEAESKTFELAIPYYQIAFTHFKRIPFWEIEFEPYKVEVRSYYEELLSTLLNESSYEELGYFLEALSALDASVDRISQLFLDHIRKEISSNNKDKLMTLARQTLAYCHNSDFKEKLSESLYFYIQNLIENHDIDSVLHVWPIYHQISAHPQEDKEALSRLILEKIEGIVEFDDTLLTKSCAWLQLLTSFELAEEYKALLLDHLTPKIKKMWEIEAPKAWLFSKYLDQFMFEEHKELFHGKMIEMIENLQSTLKNESSGCDLLKEATQYFHSDNTE